MSALQTLLTKFRNDSKTQREKGTYFEGLTVKYLENEPMYQRLYSKVWTFSDWAKEYNEDGKDTGIDLVALTHDEELHAIQCKFYDESHRIQKSDIDSFFTASGKHYFNNRIIVTTSTNWSDNAEKALSDQNPPVSIINLQNLEQSAIDWAKYTSSKTVTLNTKFSPRPHQELAINNVLHAFKTVERGKLIMACGTGKTFTSLRLAENQAGAGKRVLFLVPSLSLLSQTLTEWTQQSNIPLNSFAVCSDSDIGKKRNENDDLLETLTHELQYPATTQADKLANAIDKRHNDNEMSVVYSTYHSIGVISKAQKEYNLADFDLIICDEAHRTTGSTLSGEDDSAFTQIHDREFIKGTKRLYMTATPRIFADVAKANAETESTQVYSMDDTAFYGETLHTISFSEAVQKGLLCDYKVIVLAVDSAHISTRIQHLLKDENNSLKLDDAAKIIGCWKALSKQDQESDLEDDLKPMKKAVAFCQVIEPQKESNRKGKHKVSSKNIAGLFEEVVNAYQESALDDDERGLNCIGNHIDGSMNASKKLEKINWLKAETEDDECRILSNVRCLSEGVDVPALDAVIFLTPRNSQVDVVQSVGRVMRKSKGKKRGYVILPVVIPAGVSATDSLHSNEEFKVVWQVLQALRSHDDRFDAMVNKIDLVGSMPTQMEVIAVTDKLATKKNNATKSLAGKGKYEFGSVKDGRNRKYGTEKDESQQEMTFDVSEVELAIYATVVKKCGNRKHWEDWANDIAKIAETHITRIKTIINHPDNKAESKAFKDFLAELRDDLNDSIGETEVIEMLAQHLITKPVFEALFDKYSFASENPVSQAMQGVLDLLDEHNINKEADTLEGFYASVKMRAQGIDDAGAKQKIIVELYDKFFRNAFPKMTERLGIVYTPVEVVDFIIHSISDVLKAEFNLSLGDKNVHILDPFTGTGTFITRLMQSGLISPEQLKHKYKHEIHANELVLLAYYIATINIEAVYHAIAGKQDDKGNITDYTPFEGICLTDTFQLHEKDDLIQHKLKDNSDRRIKQKAIDSIQVIMGNPPYSVGQTSANDDNANLAYPILDGRIADTYALNSNSAQLKSLYDSYIRAIRWASDRISNQGVIGFVSNASFLESQSSDGLRKCLVDEFSDLYIFHLRGNQRTSGELSRQEGGKIFGSGSRTPVSISILVKNSHKQGQKNQKGNIHWYDIGDYLSQSEKLNIIADFKSINGIKHADKWQSIIPDRYNDWINQRDDSYYEHIQLGTKEKNNTGKSLFHNYSLGISTNRDLWVYNFSKNKVNENMGNMISFYNTQVNDLILLKLPKGYKKIVSNDLTKIKWSDGLYNKASKGIKAEFDPSTVIKTTYRPFQKSYLYFDSMLNERQGQITSIFPTPKQENLVICVSGAGSKKGFNCLILDKPMSLDTLEKTQCFPMYLYESDENNEGEYIKNDGITDIGLNEFHTKLNVSINEINKQDLFYYIYGMLHNEQYRAKYADNLSKELPRIPCAKSLDLFKKIEQVGRKLAELHINYETVEKYPVTLNTGNRNINDFANKHYRVTKMKQPKVKGTKKVDLTTIIYNEYITVSDIPLEAYDYTVNGKTAIGWVIDRQQVSTDKKTGIENDANNWAIDEMNNAKYPLELLQRVITVSIETMKLVKSLPKWSL